MATFSASLSAQTQIIAHRGFWDCEGSAQNSLSSLANAQNEALFGSECDIQLTSDGVVVLNHDDGINGYVINKTTYAELKTVLLKNGEQIPTLESCLAQTAKYPGTKLIIEIKPKKEKAEEDRVVAAALELVRKMKSDDRVEYISFSLYICRELKRLDPNAIITYLASDPQTALTPEQIKAEGLAGIDYHYTLFDVHPEWIKNSKELGLTTNVWTVNDKSVMKKFADLDIDYITTDKPLELRELLQKISE